jgi:hypothetical protein
MLKTGENETKTGKPGLYQELLRKITKGKDRGLLTGSHKDKSFNVGVEAKPD